MKLQHQTKFGGASAPHGSRGNCWAACIATLLGIDLALVPNFADVELPGEDEEAHARESSRQAREWAAAHGLLLVHLSAKWLDAWSDATVIAVGKAPGGTYHCVLWRGGELLHDPAPGGRGIAEPEWFDLFVVVDGERFREAIAREALAAQGLNVGALMTGGER